MNEIVLRTERINPFALAERSENESNGGALVQVASNRAAQEVQASMIMAKKFPRNEEQAFTRIMRACQRKSLAEQATYAYPRGDTTVTGPSIRLAEAIAQAWGNIEFGISELEQRDGESSVMAFAYDLETNSRQTKTFQVPHKIKAKGGFKVLTDPRDIYELTANQGARRLRACILGVIPGDIVDAAVDECEKTLTKDAKDPLVDRVRKMAVVFNDIGVTVTMLEKRLQHKLDSTIEQELVQLRRIFTAIKDGAGKREDYFDLQAGGAPVFTQSAEDTKAEADLGLAPAHLPVDSAPAPVLGADKPKKAKPAAAPVTATTPVQEEKPAEQKSVKQITYDTLKGLIADSGLFEYDVIEYLVGKGDVPMGGTFGKCSTELLQNFVTNWEAIKSGITEQSQA